MVFTLVRALWRPLRHRRTSRQVMVRRGLTAAYACGVAPSVLVTGLLLANEQRLSGPPRLAPYLRTFQPMPPDRVRPPRFDGGTVNPLG